jgi:hypothetical protein
MSEEGIFLLYRLCGFIDDLKVIHIYSLFPHMTKTEYNQPNMKLFFSRIKEQQILMLDCNRETKEEETEENVFFYFSEC